MNYFLMTYTDNAFFGYAKSPKGLSRLTLLETGFIKDWKRPEFVLTKGEFSDYLNCDISWPLLSAESKNIITNFARNKNEIQWLDVIVNQQGQYNTYFIPHLMEKPDVLDLKRSFFGPRNILIKPVFDKSKIGTRDVFSHLKRRYALYVSDRLRQKIEQAKLSGYCFEKTRVI